MCLLWPSLGICCKLSHINLLLCNHQAIFKQIWWQEWSLGGPLAMAMSILTYIPGLSEKYFIQPIYTYFCKLGIL
jgi:hypothetical protein